MDKRSGMVNNLYIILDVEFNGRKFASELPQEILEIGAVKVNEKLQMLDQFHSVVKPVYFSKLNRFVKQKTGIMQEEIDAAEGFVPVFGRFQEWMQDETMLFVSWGGEDMKVMLQDLRFHKIETSWAQNPIYIDLLKDFKVHYDLKNDMNLKEAVEHAGLEWEGDEHRALSDAINTAHIFVHLYTRMKLEPRLYVEHALNKKMRGWLKAKLRTSVLIKNGDVEAFYASQEFQDFVQYYKIDNRKLEKVKDFVVESLNEVQKKTD
jgi:inhibitor of KinA sporulation pathway (predicted exonuclease)